MADESFLTVEEAASRLGVSPATVRRRCATGVLVARKVGRGWLVDAGRLPPSRKPVAKRRRATASTAVDFAAAIQHLRSQDLRRDLWVPDILRHEDDLSNPDSLISSAAAKLDRTEPFDPPINIPVPKSPFFLRNAMNLSLADRLAYHAAVAVVAPQIEARTHPNVFSARLSSDARRFLKDGTESWVQWKTAVQRRVEELDGWMVETDITAYFDCISHTVLMQDLQGLVGSSPVIDPIREMVRTWATAPNTGIPQGPDASRILANFYMLDIDEVMVANPHISYFRYMDDIRIVSDSRHAAVEALKALDNECRRRNLSLSTKKTELRHGTQAVRSMSDSSIDDAKYAFDSGEDPVALRKQLCALFRSALAKDGVNARRAKFSLYRLRAIREDGILGLALRRLDDLAPLGWLVPAYLLPWLRRKSVGKGIEGYLNDHERNTSDFLSTWLLGGLLDEPLAITPGLLQYARRIGADRRQSSYHRAVALNVLALGLIPRDIASIREIIKREYDPEVVRGAVVALFRVQRLDKGIAANALRLPGLQVTLDYLRSRRDLPSLVMSGPRNRVT